MPAATSIRLTNYRNDIDTAYPGFNQIGYDFQSSTVCVTTGHTILV